MILRAPRDGADLIAFRSLLVQYDVGAHYAADPDFVRTELHSRVMRHSLDVLLAFDFTPAGFIIYFYDTLQLRCHFCDMFVVPEYRGGPVAISMAKAVKAIAQGDGMESCIFETPTYNPRVWERTIGGRIEETTMYTGRFQ